MLETCMTFIVDVADEKHCKIAFKLKFLVSILLITVPKMCSEKSLRILIHTTATIQFSHYYPFGSVSPAERDNLSKDVRSHAEMGIGIVELSE
ncbi:hypothetical protein KIN20_029514 [Parelaphostrongylus tenuis]|uniref:Uncharacterized protein n=1 Tax=Parelaphostrongylus tenuis TaxID=148309 RepID=A0AAD5WFJ6_PARTN|nr:hypothetical protein KIN20_029514 [Parelaphostrongylus tenuis]